MGGGQYTDLHTSTLTSSLDTTHATTPHYESHLAHQAPTHTHPQLQATIANTSRFSKRFYLIIGILFNLCLLGFFKYTDFFLENFNLFSQILHLDFHIPLPHILLPLALSFVTFQQIAFLVDCYKNSSLQGISQSNLANLTESNTNLESTTQNPILESKKHAESKQNLEYSPAESPSSLDSINFLDYCLFITFFPQLIAGPIVHHKEMMPQFARLSKRNSSMGMQCEGFSKFPEARTPSSLTSENLLKTTHSHTAYTRILESNDIESRASLESPLATDSQQKTDSVDARDSKQGFAHSYNSCEAPNSRPCRGVKNALRKCRSAFLAFLTRQGDSEALPLIAEKKKRRFILFGAKGSGERINPFSFCDNMRFKESRKYSLQLDSQTNTQSHHVDSHHTESKNRHCEPCRMQGVAIHNNINTADSKKILDSTPITKSPFCDYESVAKGLFIFSIGLFKKVFIADSFAKWANAGFSAVEKGEILNIFESWITALSYTFQLYFDFSGYCDMAIGLGLLFGIMLPINFNSPYKALNIADFWRRWHITLGRFLREYVYIPLGGNRNIPRKNSPFSFGHSPHISEASNHFADSQDNIESTMLTQSYQGFAQSNISAQSAETESHPLRGAQNRNQGGSSASADLELEAEKRGSPLDCRAEGLRAERSKNSGGFFGAKGSGVGINPFLRKNTLDSEKIENIRENEILRNENLKSEQRQNLDCHESANADFRNDNMSDTIDSHKNSAFFSNDNVDSLNNTQDSKAIASSHQKPSLHDTLYNKLFTLRNLFIVFFLSGIWHGAGWGFVVWGTLHGIAMCVQRVYVMFYTKLDATNPYRIFMHTKMYKVLCWFLTFNFINIAWVFFRAENLNGALNLLKGMFGITWVELPHGFYKAGIMLAHIGGTDRTLLYTLLAFIIVLMCRNGVEQMRSITKTGIILSGIWFGLAVVILSYADYQAPFLYFNF